MNIIQYLDQYSDFAMVITSICSVFLSIIAIFISVYTVMSQNTFNRNSVKPFCDIKMEIEEKKLKIQLWNCGLGVMVIDKIEYYMENKPIQISEIFNKTSSTCKTYAEWEYDDSSLAAGDSVPLLVASFSKQTDVDKGIDKLEKVHIRVDFHDIYEIKGCRKFFLQKTCLMYKNARLVMGNNSIVIE